MAPYIFSQPYSPSSANNAEARGFAASVRPLRLLRLLRPPQLLLPELLLKPGNLLPAQRSGIRFFTPSAGNRPLQLTGTSRCLPRRTTTPAGSRHSAEPAGSATEGHYNRQRAAQPQPGSLRDISGKAGPQTADSQSSDARDILSPLYRVGGTLTPQTPRPIKSGNRPGTLSAAGRAGSPSAASCAALGAFRGAAGTLSRARGPIALKGRQRPSWGRAGSAGGGQ